MSKFSRAGRIFCAKFVHAVLREGILSTKFVAADLREGISATNSLPQFVVNESCAPNSFTQFVGKKFGVPNSFPLFGEKEFPPVDASAQVRGKKFPAVLVFSQLRGNEFPLVPKLCRTSICEFSKKTRKQRIRCDNFRRFSLMCAPVYSFAPAALSSAITSFASHAFATMSAVLPLLSAAL